MTAGKYDFTIEGGADLVKAFHFPDTYSMFTSATLIANTSSDAASTVINLNSSGTVNYLSVNTSTKTLAIIAVPTYTDALTFDTADYQLYVTFPSGRVDRMFEGIITHSADLE